MGNFDLVLRITEIVCLLTLSFIRIANYLDERKESADG